MWSPRVKGQGRSLRGKSGLYLMCTRPCFQSLELEKRGGGSLSNLQVQEANFKLGKQVICYGLSQSNCSKSNKKQKPEQWEDGLSGAPRHPRAESLHIVRGIC